MEENKEFSVWAIAGFVLSFFGIFAVLGLTFSIVGLSQTKNNQRRGRGLAIAGLIISIIVLIITVFAWIASFIIMNTPITPPTKI